MLQTRSLSILLITPPFTQLNTPYPATAYLKGFLKTKGIPAVQADLGIEVIVEIFSKNGLTRLFKEIDAQHADYSENSRRILNMRNAYLQTIEEVVSFLQNKKPTLANRIASRRFLPEASRFEQVEDLQWAFGNMGIQDKAKHIATLYLEDLSDLIKETIDEHFGFSRYAEKLGRSANSFDELNNTLEKAYRFVDHILIEILAKKISEINPTLVALSVPFPGNLYASLRCGQWIKAHHPNIKVALGGGFANTELRSLTDSRVFDHVDFITLDDGERPLELIWEYIQGKREASSLKRTFLRINNQVEYINDSTCHDYKQHEVGTPDYSDLHLDNYISAIEIANPMHTLWSDGRWNKLTMAHGCYWGKCTFCDISLDYIKIYEPLAASLIVDRMEELILQTGENGFHFVDEAAPPSLMKSVALEIIKRKLVVSWWTNVRFEKSFTRDLCLLLSASGCIAVSGGLEVASDRLLNLIDKGITVEQVAKVCRNFTESGIMVHAYLMYGFPTQTAQETIDSLEMVRQLFKTGVLKSGFWHLFTMTAHSPIGLAPENFGVRKKEEKEISFANNDIDHIDPTGTEHENFGFGLRKALLNYMHGTCFDFPLQKWFDFSVPKTTIDPNVIQHILDTPEFNSNANGKFIWIGNDPLFEIQYKSKKGSKWEVLSITFLTHSGKFNITVDPIKGKWLIEMLKKLDHPISIQKIKDDYAKAGFDHFELFWDNKPVNTLYKAGLLRV